MKHMQKMLDDTYRRDGWEYWSPMSILARLMEEVGEFARVVNKVYGQKKSKKNEHVQVLEDEFGDILYTLACFANSHDIDMDEALQKSIEKVHKNQKELYAGSKDS